MARILIAESRLSSGKYTYAGKEKMVQWLGNGLAELNHEVTFCTSYDSLKSPKMSEKVSFIPLKMHYYSSFLKRNFTFFTIYPFKIAKILHRNRFDYVVSFGDTSYFILLLLKRFFAYKLIVSERGDPYYNISILDKIRRSLYRKADYLVFQTKGAQSFFGSKVINKSVVIPNPISIPSEKWTLSGAMNSIASVGRIDFLQKRQDLLCKAFAEVLKKHPLWKLNIYGSGKDMEELKSLIKNLGIEDEVVLHGAVNNINEALLTNKVFVLSSDFEGIPNSLLEAMALGMPVISTDCSPGGAAMLIQTNTNGILVDRGDIKGLSSSICKLIDQPDIAVEMGRKARACMSQYSEAKIINEWNRIFL